MTGMDERTVGRSLQEPRAQRERERDSGIVLVGQQQQNFTLRIDRQKLRSVRVEQKQKQHFIAHSTFDPIYNNVMSVRGGREGGRSSGRQVKGEKEISIYQLNVQLNNKWTSVKGGRELHLPLKLLLL